LSLRTQHHFLRASTQKVVLGVAIQGFAIPQKKDTLIFIVPIF